MTLSLTPSPAACAPILKTDPEDWSSSDSNSTLHKQSCCSRRTRFSDEASCLCQASASGTTLCKRQQAAHVLSVGVGPWCQVGATTCTTPSLRPPRVRVLNHSQSPRSPTNCYGTGSNRKKGHICLGGRGRALLERRGAGGRGSRGSREGGGSTGEPPPPLPKCSKELQKCTTLTHSAYTFVIMSEDTQGASSFWVHTLCPHLTPPATETGNTKECSLSSNSLSKINLSWTHLS